jgi:hypothetical protein
MILPEPGFVVTMPLIPPLVPRKGKQQRSCNNVMTRDGSQLANVPELQILKHAAYAFRATTANLGRRNFDYSSDQDSPVINRHCEILQTVQEGHSQQWVSGIVRYNRFPDGLHRYSVQTACVTSGRT